MKITVCKQVRFNTQFFIFLKHIIYILYRLLTFLIYDFLSADASNSLWSNANENEDDLTYVFNETTPAKSFEDLAYQVTDNGNLISFKEKQKKNIHFIFLLNL